MVSTRVLALLSAAAVLACAVLATADDTPPTVRGFVKAQRIGTEYGFAGMELRLEVGGSTETIELAPKSSGVIYVAAVAPDELVRMIERLKQTVIPAAPARFMAHVTPDYAVVVGLAEIPADVTVRLTLDDAELLFSPEPMRERMRIHAHGYVSTIRSAQGAYFAANKRYGTFADLTRHPVMYLSDRFAVEGEEAVLPAYCLTIRLFDVSENGYGLEARNDEYGITIKLDERGNIVMELDPDWP